MKVAALLFVVLAGLIFSVAMAQVPSETKLQHFTMQVDRDTLEGKKLDFVITGISGSNINAQTALVNKFELKSFRNGDPKQIQIIAQAPQCRVDVVKNVASDQGHLQVFSPTTNLFVQGVGFLFTQSNHFLIISNQVETRVVKALLKSSMLAPRTNTAAEAGQVVLIYARHGEFALDSNVVDYVGSVHLIDPQLDMTCDFLTIRFTTNGAVESMLARQNVVLTTTNNGRATGVTGFYYVTNGNEMMRLTKDAVWRNGDQEAKANEFIYDSTRKFLTGIGHVWVQWPNAVPKPPGAATNPAPLLVGTNGFRELFADFATLQFPPTNGPVESMHARGNVLILNQADQSSATAEQAVYEKSTDRVELTGSPVWWTTNMEVKANMLVAELGDKTYHARTNSRFKMRTGGGATNHPAASSGNTNNQWVFIASDDMDYRTNQAVFYRNVKTRVVENDRLHDTLNCDLLTLNLVSNQVESGFASGSVHGETAPDAVGVIKTITCGQLNAFRSLKTLLMKTLVAYTNVVIQEIGTTAGAPSNQLSADTVTAQFFATTNRIREAVAEQNVVFDQLKAGRLTHATAERAVYTAGIIDQVKLTGTPLAHNDKDMITDADYMIWEPKANKFQAFGRYIILPINKPVAGKKSL